MGELLQHYTGTEIFTFIVLLAISIKGLIQFYDWTHDRILQAFNKKYDKMTVEEELQQKINTNTQMMTQLQNNQKATDLLIAQLTEKIDLLIASDKDDIKSYITKEHHYFCYQKGWIDDFSLDCLERRYQHYADEGGNSFIAGFMNELRSLPKHPPEEEN